MNPDPYVQFRRNDEEYGLRNGVDNPQRSKDDNRKKKKTRGFTQMRGIWGRRDSDGPLDVSCNKFGQPDDENGTKLSNFIGTLIRDGNDAPLMYKSWHKVPTEYKEKMWKILQTKFNLNESSKTWVMQKFGVKLRNWRFQIKRKCYKKDAPLDEQMKSKDPRVSDEHLGYLLNSWSTSSAEEISQRNKISRSFRIHNHTTGTKSFARVANEQTTQLEHEPSRAELFKCCFTKKDGTQAESVKNAITEMQKEVEIINESDEVISRNDAYAKVMGREKNGRVRMLGAGVCPSLIFNDVSSRGANQNSIIKALRDQNKELRTKLEQLKSQDVYVPGHGNTDSDPTQAHDDLSPIVQVANRVDWSFGSFGSMNTGSLSRTPKIGDEVCLKSIVRVEKTVAVGILYSTDPFKEVGSQELGDDDWEIYIKVAVMPNERLIRSCAQYKLIGDTVESYIAWPKYFVMLKDDGARLYG